jgi:hypothetical protein
MKGRDPPGLYREQPLDPFLHLSRRLFGKGDGKYPVWLDPLFLYQPGYFMGDYLGLAGTCARKHKQWRAIMLDRIFLLFI